MAGRRMPFVITVAMTSVTGGCSGSEGSSGSGGNAHAPVCPVDLPANGAECLVKGLSCEYDGGDDGCNQRIRHDAYCTSSMTWNVSTQFPGQTCNPPPPPAPPCPEQEPAPGTGCTDPGFACSYPASCDGGSSGVTNATCMGGAWSIAVDCG